MKIQRIVLPAPTFCGRGVRVQVLDRPTKELARMNAAREVASGRSDGGTIAEKFLDDVTYRTAALHECKLAMVVGCTKKDGYKTIEDVAALPLSEWMPVDSDTYAEIFGKSAKDDDAIATIYTKLNGIDESDIEAIVGKAVDESEG